VAALAFTPNPSEARTLSSSCKRDLLTPGRGGRRQFDPVAGHHILKCLAAKLDRSFYPRLWSCFELRRSELRTSRLLWPTELDHLNCGQVFCGQALCGQYSAERLKRKTDWEKHYERIGTESGVGAAEG
jgi:hypothetical protein